MGKPFTTGDLVNIVSYDSAGNVTLPASLTLPGNLSVFGRFFDSYSSPGTAGQFLKSTGTGTEWVNITASGGGLLGSGVATRIAFWQDSQTLTSNANLYWDNTNSRLGIGTASPVAKLQISSGDIFLDYDKLIGGGSTYNSIWNRINFYNGGTGDLEITLHNINWYLRHNANATFAGNVGIGTTAPSSTLDVKGSGNTSATTALTVQNSDGTALFQVTNGQIVLFNTARTLSGAMLLQSSGGGNTTGFTFGLLNPFTATSGSTYLITNASSFEPTSGTGTYTFLSARPTINQTGGANGITRGIHVQPTLTAAADWRSIEWSNNTGYGLYGAGTAKNYLAGSLGIGTTSPSQTLTVSGNAYITGAYYDSTNTSGTSGQILSSTGTGTIWIAAPTGGGSGTVTSVAALTIGTTGTDLSSTVANSTTTPVITLNVPTASATNRGVLSSADWSTFNGKQNTITLTTTGSSGAATFVTNTLNIPNYTLSGLGGEPIITAGTTAQYWRGDKSFQTLNTAAVVESTNLYYTDARSRAAVSLTTTGSSGAATYSSATGVFNIPNYTLTGLGGFANPMTTLGDMIYGAASGTPTRFVGNITTTKQYLSQTGTGAASAAPVWSTITGTDVTGNALTKTDDTNVTLTLGGTPSAALLRAASITVGWTGQLAVGRGGSGASTLTGVLIGNGTSAFTGVAGTANQLLRRNAGDTAYEFFTPTYLTTAITSLNGLTAATQTFTNDTNVTITSATSAHTLGWSGQLSVGRGGSGASTLTGVLIGNGTSAFTGVAGTANQLLRRNAGNTAYEFFTPTYTTGSGTATQVAFWSSSTGLSGDSALYWDNTLKTLGIGTTSPTEKLVVSDNGAAGFEYIPATGRWYRFNRSTLAYGGIYTEASEHTWSINATEHVRLSSGGNFGIGNNNPTYKLDVTGDARIASGSLGVGVVPNATDGRIDASNDIVAYSSSDERLKVNIKPIENAIDKVIALNGVEYDWNPEFINSHGYSGHDIGVIAHEVQAIFPEAVRIGGHGYLMVRYEKLIPLLIQAIKEQQTHIDLLMSKYDA